MATQRREQQPTLESTLGPPNQLLTARDVGKRWQISAWAVYELAKRTHDALPSIRFGRRLTFRLADVQVYEERHSHAPSTTDGDGGAAIAREDAEDGV